MKHMNHLFVVILIFAGFLLSACGGQVPVTGDKVAPSKLEPIEGTDLSRVLLTEKMSAKSLWLPD